MSAFPPQRSVASIPISPDIALKYLSAYLEAAKSSPHLLPNARLEPFGPTAGSSNSSITVHNLRRVEAALRGERLAPTLELEENSVPIADGMDDGTNKQREIVDGEVWMDLDEYQREQSIEGGAVADKPTAQEVNSDLEVVGIEKGADESGAASQKSLDKEARKAAKKARLKEERKQKGRATKP